MQMSSEKSTPPFVTFEFVPTEDRAETIRCGRLISVDVAYVNVTQPGSKDVFKGLANEWLNQMTSEVQGGRLPAAWLTAWKADYAAWQANEELPAKGTSVKTFPGLSPAQIKNCLGIGIRTLEELAVANEEVIHRLGMGAREMKARAVEFLKQAEQGASTSELLALREEVARLQATVKEQAEKLETLRALQPGTKKPL